jgi:NitT/TauT family transport system permease protein
LTKRRWRAATEALYPVGTILLLLGVWQTVVVFMHVPEVLLPAPTRIIGQVVAKGDVLTVHSLVTLREILLGFGLAVAVGIPAAVLLVNSRLLNRGVYPLLVSSQTVPKVAIAPLFLIWFGFGILPKILVAFLICFFPIVIDTVVGLRSVPIEMLYLARSMGLNATMTFMKIRLPFALPNIFAGLKVAITLSVVGAIVGEFVAADQGLGYLLVVANGNLDSATAFAVLTVLSIIGVALFEILDVAERLLLSWHVSHRLEMASGTA